MQENASSASPRAARTDAPVAAGIVAADVDAVLATLARGGVAIIPTCLTYAIVGNTAAAIDRIFSAKARSFDKPCGCFGSPAMSRELHDLCAEKHDMIRVLKEQEGLPFSVVAPFRASHGLLQNVDPAVLRNASKGGTMDMVISGGPFVEALAKRSFSLGIPVFGSSANRSLNGSKYRLGEIEPEVLDAADLKLDYGVSRYATPQGLSSTIIDFSDFSTVRVGHRFGDLQDAFKRRFGISLRSNAAP